MDEELAQALSTELVPAGKHDWLYHDCEADVALPIFFLFIIGCIRDLLLFSIWYQELLLRSILDFDFFLRFWSNLALMFKALDHFNVLDFKICFIN